MIVSRAAAIGAILVCMSACASLQGHAPAGAPDAAAWQAHRDGLLKLIDWEFSGRVGIVTAKDGGSGSLDWKQQGDALTFDFRGPLGAGAIHIQGEGSTLVVQASRGDSFITDDPEHDIEQRLKVPLPVLSMRYWMLGLPDPHAGFDEAFDEHGELTRLTQRGWQVQYQEYAEVRGLSLPVKLSLQRSDVRIKVVISDWTLTPPAP